MFEEQKFNIPETPGISTKQTEVHLGLYGGYVKHVNTLMNLIENTTDAYTRAELRRRLAFEYDGMRNHEIYFDSMDIAPSTLSDGNLQTKIKESFGSMDDMLASITAVAKETRGIGWIVAGYDKVSDNCLINWVGDHELGHITNIKPIVMVDIWEHAYMVDYTPSEKIKYVESYIKALNWDKISKRFDS